MRWVLIGCLGAPVMGCASSKKELAGGPEAARLAQADLSVPAVTPEELSVVSAEEALKAGRLEDIQAAVSAEPTEAAEAVPLGQVGPETEEYTVQPEDVLQITVFEEPDLTTQARVTSSGEITFPLLGRVTVAGLAVPQVQEKLTTLLAEDYLVNPQVQVFLDTSLNPRRVFVTGAVTRPGSYTISAERLTTFMEAIAMAGGFSEEASVNGTRIIRIEHGRERTILVRANDIITKGDKSQDVALRPGDIIFVPESFF